MKYEIHPDLDKILSKLAKRDRVQFEALLKKMDDIIHSDRYSIEHYKNLRSPLQRYKRVHVYASFVLLFRVDGETIMFRQYDHHDRMYKFSE